MADNIRVAVRIRSFDPNFRGDSSLRTQEPDTILISNKSQKSPKKLQFNRVFWSCDGHRKRADGYLEPDGPNSIYADQEKIYKETGEELVSHLLDGYNCTLFAYGQTGSGKSYSLMERGVNKGLLPRIGVQIFRFINDNWIENVEYQISFSMLEIYNEGVYDLLATDRKREKLKIMENKAKNLRLIPVSSPKELQGHLNSGYKSRSIAATKMNQQSSRAHTIVMIHLKKLNSNDKTQRTSQFNIVDLAGSERVAKSKTEGDRLKESGNINKSLHALGKVINCLSKQTMEQQEETRPNYRESKLTLLLKDSLGGNSKTVMLAAVSPKESNYYETMSTLRYASSVMCITNKSKVNEAERIEDKGIEDVLQKLIKTKEELFKAKKEHREDVDRLQTEIEELRSQLSKTSADQKGTDDLPSNPENQDNRLKSVPHLLNLNEDDTLSKVVRFFIEKGQNLFVGGRKSDVPNENYIQIGSIQIDKLAEIRNKDGKVFLKPFKENGVAVNGKRLQETEEFPINHRDRLMLGNTRALYVFMDPTDANFGNLDDITFEMASDEILSHVDIEQKIPIDEMTLEKKVKRRQEDVGEANAKAVMLDKPLKFELQLTSAYFLGINDPSQVVLVNVLNENNKCRYIWTEDEFLDAFAAMNDDRGTEDDDDNETRVDPFDINCDTCYTPIGISFIDIHSLSSNRSVPKCLINVADSSAKIIGKISISFDICSKKWIVQGQPKRLSPVNLINTRMFLKIFIKQIEFLENMGEGYRKIKCSFYLPSISEEDDGNTECVETKESNGELPIFNFEKKWEIPSVNEKHLQFFNDILIVRVWGIPKPVPGSHNPRGNLREVTELLREKEDIIKGLKEERNKLREEKDELTKAVQRHWTTILKLKGKLNKKQ